MTTNGDHDMQTDTIESMTRQFVSTVQAAIEQMTADRIRDALGSIGGAGKRGPGRPPGKAKRKLPIQYCPVPGCKNRAAPVFGMVCGTHRGVSQAKIKKYRDQRRARKAAGRS